MCKMKSVLLVCSVIGMCLLFHKGICHAAQEFNDGGVHDFSETYYYGLAVSNNTTLNILDGAHIEQRWLADGEPGVRGYEAVINISGGFISGGNSSNTTIEGQATNAIKIYRTPLTIDNVTIVGGETKHEIDSSAHALEAYDNSVVIINNGDFTGGKGIYRGGYGVALRDTTKVTINGGSYTGGGAFHPDSGNINGFGGGGVYMIGGELVINGGEFSSAPSFQGSRVLDLSRGKTTINGGTFTDSQSVHPPPISDNYYKYDHCIFMNYGAELSISGGVINGSIYILDASSILNIHGTNLVLENGQLTGTLTDGNLIDCTVYTGSTEAQINLIAPEPVPVVSPFGIFVVPLSLLCMGVFFISGKGPTEKQIS